MWECDVCHQTPCQTRTFCKLCRIDERKNPNDRPPPPRSEPSPFAESIIQATKWLKKYYPERLPAWLARAEHAGLAKHLGIKLEGAEDGNQK
jgi:hypothetical protein